MRVFNTILFLAIALPGFAQTTWIKKQLAQKPKLSGMYLQWGYNRDLFSRSDLHFANGDKYNFTIEQAKAVDQPDFTGFWTSPIDITIPQNSFRIGFYLNQEHTWAMEINFDHAKYVVNDNQVLHVKGMVQGEPIDKDTVIRRQFVHFEHTNGANFYHINYVHQQSILEGKRFTRATMLYKMGAGVVVPRSDVTILGKRLDNEFHVAGYIISAEAGFRYYLGRHFFMELNGKAGFANYLNVLTVEGGKAHHHFWYLETIGLAGYDINFGHHKRKNNITTGAQ